LARLCQSVLGSESSTYRTFAVGRALHASLSYFIVMVYLLSRFYCILTNDDDDDDDSPFRFTFRVPGKLKLGKVVLISLYYVMKVRRLLAVCPKNTGGTGGVFHIDERGLDAVVALGIYHLESGLEASVVSWLKSCLLFNFLGRPEQPFRTGLYFAQDVFSFRHWFSELPRPIALKLCHMVGI